MLGRTKGSKNKKPGQPKRKGALEHDIDRVMTEKPKSSLVLDCHCDDCGTDFVVADIDKHLEQVGNGIHLSEYSCPNCKQNSLDIHIMRVKSH